MKIGEKIKYLRLKFGLTQEDVAKAIATTKQAIYKYENGIVTNIPIDKVQKIADLFNTTPSYLMGWEVDEEISPISRPITRKRLPMLGNVACGEPIFAEEDHNAYVDADANVDADFCLTAQGDSMINARIFDGDILFVKKQNTVHDGDIAVVLIEDSATVKRVYFDKENSVLTLIPENPTHKPMRFSGSQLEQIRILGKVIAGQYFI